jgi:predicted GH43/DUF377 family glycosyl hydrolase
VSSNKLKPQEDLLVLHKEVWVEEPEEEEAEVTKQCKEEVESDRNKNTYILFNSCVVLINKYTTMYIRIYNNYQPF